MKMWLFFKVYWKVFKIVDPWWNSIYTHVFYMHLRLDFYSLFKTIENMFIFSLQKQTLSRDKETVKRTDTMFINLILKLRINRQRKASLQSTNFKTSLQLKTKWGSRDGFKGQRPLTLVHTSMYLVSELKKNFLISQEYRFLKVFFHKNSRLKPIDAFPVGFHKNVQLKMCNSSGWEEIGRSF